MIDKNDPRLTAFVLGELDEQESKTIQTAIAASPQLHAAVDEIRKTSERLAEQFAAEPVEALTQQQRDAIFAAGATDGEMTNVNVGSGDESAPTKHDKVRSKRRWTGWLIAAGAAFVLGSIIYNAVDWTEGDPLAKAKQQDLRAHSYHDAYKRLPSDELDSSRGMVLDEVVDGNPAPEPHDPNHSQDPFLGELPLSQAKNELEDDFGVIAGNKGFVDADESIRGRRAAGIDLKYSRFGWEDESTKQLGVSREAVGGVRLVVPSTDGQTRGEELPALASNLESFYFSQDHPGETASDTLLRQLLKRVDPSGGQDVQIRSLKEDQIEILVEGKKVEELNLGVYFEALNRDNVQTGRSFGGRSGKVELEKLGWAELGKDITEKLSTRNRKLAVSRKSWKRVKATANTSRLMVGDKGDLKMQGMQASVQVDGFRARVLLDCFYYNDRSEQLEGTFKLRLPDDASLYYFAFGPSSHEFIPQGELSEQEFVQPQGGESFVSLQPTEITRDRRLAWESVKEARMVPKEKAALAYTQTVRRKVDPALVEWAGAGVFSARVFPLLPKKLHRIVIGYDVSLTRTDDGLGYRLDLPEELGQCKVDLNVTATAGSEVSITPQVKPTGDQSQYLYSFTNSKLGDARSIELNLKTDGAVLLRSGIDEEAEFWTTQFTPDLPQENAAANSHAMFLLDTSLSSNPEKFNVWLKMLHETLTQNRNSMKQFGVMMFNVESYFWRDGYVENTPENVAQLIADCEELALEGATDLYGAVDLMASTKWVTANRQHPDLFLLSDGAATWGETNLRLVQNRIADANVGSLFAYQTGMTGTAISGLRFLADRSGGAVFSVASEAEVVQAATAHRNRPWQIQSMHVAGGSDLMTAGRVSWVYPGQTITVVGRGSIEGNLNVELTQGSSEHVVNVEFSDSIDSPLASRMYGYVSVGQLESLGSQLEDVAASYARHFRITGQTCSLLMLETEEDYQRFNIVPQEDLFVIKTRNATELVEKVLEEKKAELVSPKVRLMTWYKKLEKMPGVTFEIPTALGLALDQVEVNAISKPVICKNRNKIDIKDDFLKLLDGERLDYKSVVAESRKRGLGSSGDAIKVLSSLIERNPGDLTLARDVAFVAMELDEPAQAYGLLRQVAMARPFEPTIYPAIGKCLTQLGKADMAILFYEVAMEGKFQNRNQDFRNIVAAEYMHLLRKVDAGAIKSNVKEYASHRLNSLKDATDFGEKDLVITMMWNTDQSDVDLHVVEPNGEDCHYGHRQTKSGGQITRDITDGFGPEMYTLRDAPNGKYQVRVKYYGSNANRTNMRSKVYLAIYRNYGRKNESVRFKSVELTKTGDLEDVATIGIE